MERALVPDTYVCPEVFLFVCLFDVLFFFFLLLFAVLGFLLLVISVATVVSLWPLLL